MAIRVEKNNEDTDIVIDGFEQGIAPSPHKGIANIQGGNISTETGEVMASFNRFKQNQTAITNGTLTASVGVGSSFLATSSSLSVGQWISVSASTILGTPLSVTASVLAVAGGGGGGGGVGKIGGGGGAGGMKSSSAVTLATGAYTITVGSGGAGGNGVTGTTGGDSSFGAVVVAKGGGGGASIATDPGATGGSGGGGAASAGAGGTGTAGQGNAGGAGSTINNGSGGGGGASTVGADAPGTSGGNGGAGTASSISGASVTYAGGGGGATNAGNTPGTGGAGGGGAGANGGGGGNGTNGTANTGGGGGGSNNVAGATGGSGIVIISVPAGYITSATGGSKTTSGGNDIWTFTASGTFTVTTLAANIALNTLNGGIYYVSSQDVSGNITLSYYYDPTAANIVVHGTTGTATFSTSPNFGRPIAKAIESYSTSTTAYYRYYILDNAGLVWVYDTQNEGTTGLTWFLPDTSTNYFAGTAPSGIAVLNGNLMVLSGAGIYFKPTVCLGDTTANATTYQQASITGYNTTTSSPYVHAAFVGHQGRMYYTDRNYIGSVFPDTSINSGAANIQSYCSYTAATTTGTIGAAISGIKPFQVDSSGATLRVPAVFFTSPGGTLPATLSADTVYWIEFSGLSNNTFEVFAAATGGSAVDIQTGSVGTQYFNTFYPHGTGGTTTFTASNQRLNLPVFETAQCMAEIGNTLLVGCVGNVVYPWNQINVLPGTVIPLPEADVKVMVTVNQMAYIFAGNKGNVYITDGSTASLVIKVPDYCAGVPGSPATYIEPYYTWGDAAFIRGRVYFSILDQTSTKAGNCGGIWSFIPTQNLYIGQDTGLALRLENKNSYGTYSGVATIILPRQTQTAGNPLYWAAWYSDVTSPTYGIDYSNTGTSASFPVILETEAVATGTMLNKKTFKQIEYKLAAPLDTTATVTLQYRANLTDAWASAGTLSVDPSALSGYYTVTFEKGQWLQLRATLTPLTSTAAANTFVRLKELRIR